MPLQQTSGVVAVRGRPYDNHANQRIALLRITRFDEGDWRTVPFEALEEDFLEICETHRAQGRALAFAFILFDRSHPYVRSALAQRNYWDALDARSGQQLSVFSLDVRPASEKQFTERRGMHAVLAPTPHHIQGALSRYFGDLQEFSLPCVLFFQVADGKVIDTAVAALAETDLTSTYAELEAVIGTAADAVARVEDENAEHAQEIFHLITSALDDRRRKQGLVRLFHAARPVGDLVGVVELLRRLLAG